MRTTQGDPTIVHGINTDSRRAHLQFIDHRHGELAPAQPAAQSGQQLTQQQAPAQPAAQSGQQLTEQQSPAQPAAQSDQQLTEQQAPACV